MKNNLLMLGAVVFVMTLLFTSCKKETDFDAICDDVSLQTIQGYFSGAEPIGNVLQIAQYNFAKDGSVEYVVTATGDGIYKAPVVTKFSSWELGEYNEQGIGRYLILTPQEEGESKVINFMYSSMIEEGMPVMADKNNKVAELPILQDSILGKTWYALDTTFFKIDTVIDVIYKDTFSHRDQIGETPSGRPIYGLVIDSIKERVVPTKMKYAIGPSAINERKLELYRDSNTYSNTGKWYLLQKKYEYDASRTPKTILDTISEYDFHWYMYSFNSLSAFSIKTIQENGKEEIFDMKYDSKVPAIILQKQQLKETK